MRRPIRRIGRQCLMGKRSKTHGTPVSAHMKRCLVHKWGYHDVDGMWMRFRVCEKCDALEAKPKVARPGAKWVSYAPSGGIGFVEALRSQIAKRTAAEENGIQLEHVDADAMADAMESDACEIPAEPVENDK